LEKENALLREKIGLLVRKLFGAKSERLDPAQLLLLLQGLDEAEETAREELLARAEEFFEMKTTAAEIVVPFFKDNAVRFPVAA